MRWSAALLLVLAVGCSTSDPGGHNAAAYLAKEFETFQGLRAGPAELRDGNRRMDIFLGTPTKKGDELTPGNEAGKFDHVIYCVALNADKDPLPEVMERINAAPADKTIYVYGRRVKRRYRIWWGGLDCVAQAVAMWHPQAKRYVYYAVDYKIPWWRQIEIQAILKRAVKAGAAVAVP